MRGGRRYASSPFKLLRVGGEQSRLSYRDDDESWKRDGDLHHPPPATTLWTLAWPSQNDIRVAHNFFPAHRDARRCFGARPPRRSRVQHRAASLPPARRARVSNVRAPTRASAAASTAAMTTTTRTIWRVNKTGALSRLERVDGDELAPPGPGEIRVKVKAIGLNFADVFSVLGLYGATPDCPFVPGLECCGVVEAIGESDPSSTRGNRRPDGGGRRQRHGGDAIRRVRQRGQRALTPVPTPPERVDPRAGRRVPRPGPHRVLRPEGAGGCEKGADGVGPLRRGRVRALRPRDMQRAWAPRPSRRWARRRR